MVKTIKVEVPFKSNLSVGELKKSLENIPDNATISVHIHQGDRPWESSTYSVTATWFEEL